MTGTLLRLAWRAFQPKLNDCVYAVLVTVSLSLSLSLSSSSVHLSFAFASFHLVKLLVNVCMQVYGRTGGNGHFSTRLALVAKSTDSATASLARLLQPARENQLKQHHAHQKLPVNQLAKMLQMICRVIIFRIFP